MPLVVLNVRSGGISPRHEARFGQSRSSNPDKRVCEFGSSAILRARLDCSQFLLKIFSSECRHGGTTDKILSRVDRVAGSNPARCCFVLFSIWGPIVPVFLEENFLPSFPRVKSAEKVDFSPVWPEFYSIGFVPRFPLNVASLIDAPLREFLICTWVSH